MLKISNEQEFLESFRPIDRAEVQIPAGMKFPMLVRYYLAWVEPSGHRTFLLFEDQSKERAQAKGIVFRRPHAAADSPPAMCDWCHAVRGRGHVGLLTASVSPNKRIGLHVCRDLSCKEKFDEIPGVNDVRESLPTDIKLNRLLDHMSNFARRHLF